MSTRPRVKHCAHWIWSPTRGQYEIPCSAHLFVVIADGKHHGAFRWAEAMEFANMLARSQRPVEVLARALVDSGALTPEAGAA